MQYRPEIDGLRAFAVIPVVIFHSGVDWMPGGFLGVDVFFVISGFLITSIVLKELEGGIFRLSNFWARRVRRIAPALLTMVFISSIAACFLLYAPDIRETGFQGIAALLSFANIYLWQAAGDYWGTTAESSLFLHTWSLSVEEQFYLLFPVTILILHKYRPSLVAPAFAAVFAFSFILFVYSSSHHPVATFYLLPTRAWELGAGCLLAVLSRNASRGSSPMLTSRPRSVLSATGLLLVLLSYVLVSGEAGVSLNLIFSVLGAFLIIAFATESACPINRILRWGPFVFVGKISYSLYLWHWPVIVLSHSLESELSSGQLVLRIVCIFLLAIGSYYLVEIPARKKTSSLPKIGVAFASAFALSAALYFSDLNEDISVFAPTVWEGDLYSVAPISERPERVRRRMQGIETPVREAVDPQAFLSGGIQFRYGDERPGIVVIGDSHALMWSGLLREIASGMRQTIAFYTADGVNPFFSIPVERDGRGALGFTAAQKYQYRESQLQHLASWRPDVVVIASLWGSKQADEMIDLIEFLGQIGSRVILLEQPPALRFGDKNAPQYISYLRADQDHSSRIYLPMLQDGSLERGRSIIREIASRYQFCSVVPITDLFLRDQSVWVVNEAGQVLYIDDDHLSSAGAKVAEDRLRQSIRDLLPE